LNITCAPDAAGAENASFTSASASLPDNPRECVSMTTTSVTGAPAEATPSYVPETVPVPRETCADRPCSTKQQPTSAAPEKSSACTNTEATVLLSKSVVGWNPLTAGSFPSS